MKMLYSNTEVFAMISLCAIQFGVQKCIITQGFYRLMPAGLGVAHRYMESPGTFYAPIPSLLKGYKVGIS